MLTSAQWIFLYLSGIASVHRHIGHCEPFDTRQDETVLGKIFKKFSL